MGRKGSKLIPFLKKALDGKKYPNLKYEHIPSQAFSLNLPQKSSRLGEECQYILQDWYRLTGRDYKFHEDYTQGKQGMEAALRRSDFLLQIQSGRKKILVYRMLNEDEVKEKKLLKKSLKKKTKKDPLEGVDCAPSPGSSGYGSGSDVPEEGLDISNPVLLHALKHDHEYEYTTYDCPQHLKNIIYNKNLPSFEIEGLFDADPSVLLNTSIKPVPQIENSSLNYVNVSSLGENPLNKIGGMEKNSSIPDPLLSDLDFEKLFTENDLLQYCNSPEWQLEELLGLNDELPPDLDKYAVENKVPTSNVVDVVSYKTQICKVYECIHRNDLPGMIVLTCEPKLKEFCISAANVDEPSSSKLFFDEETLRLMTSCIFEDIKYLPNDHILVFLKC